MLELRFIFHLVPKFFILNHLPIFSKFYKKLKNAIFGRKSSFFEKNVFFQKNHRPYEI